MSDHASAELFGFIFNELAKPDCDPTKLAKKLWKRHFDYDYCDDEMQADKALIKFGFAKKAVDPEYPDEGEVTMYRQHDGKYQPRD